MRQGSTQRRLRGSQLAQPLRTTMQRLHTVVVHSLSINSAFLLQFFYHWKQEQTLYN